MQKNTTLLLIIALAVSVIGNIFFLTQDIFGGTYYQIPSKYDNSRIVFSVDHRIVDYTRYSREDRSIETEQTGIYSITYHEGKKIIDVTALPEVLTEGKFLGLLSLYPKTIFVMSNYSNTMWYICPAAIVIQILWLAADIALVVALKKRIGPSSYKLRIVKNDT